MHVAIVGPGRLGRSLALLLGERGHTAPLIGRGEAVPEGMDAVLLTVPDAALSPLVTAWCETGSAPDVPVLHCSGALSVDVLRPLSPAGSFHPLMTFPGPDIRTPDLCGVPAAIDGDDEAVGVARALADALGMTPLVVPGDRRLYHAAAVISGNFATVLLAHAARTLEAAGVPRNVAGSALLPLALESLRNAAHDPVAALTGPVVRGDEAVIRAHEKALDDIGLTATRVLYEQLTEATRRLHTGKP